MATFHFDLVSPEKLLFSGEVDQVDIPGSEGDFGVLANHAPTVSALRPGIMTVFVGGQRAEDGRARRFRRGVGRRQADRARRPRGTRSRTSTAPFSPSASPRRKRRSRSWKAPRSTRRSSGWIISSRSTSICKARRCTNCRPAGVMRRERLDRMAAYSKDGGKLGVRPSFETRFALLRMRASANLANSCATAA